MSPRSNAKPVVSSVDTSKSHSRSVALTSVRQFQSEVAAIREGADPRSAELTIHIMALAFLAAVLALTIVRVDRVASSISGRLVTTEASPVFQALDESIIKSIDVNVGQRVRKGQLLATLDPTFTTAAVTQLKSQIDSLKSQIAKDQAELAGGGLEFPPSDDPDYGKYQKVQKELFDQQMGQYNAQLQSFDQKIALTQVTIGKYKSDEARYKDEGNVSKQVEDMWATLQSHGNGSLLSLLSATNAKLESLRTMEFDQNSVVENEHALASLQADRAAFVQQFRSTTSQDLVTQRNALDAAEAQLDSAMMHKDLVRLIAPEDAVVLSIVKLSVGSVLKQGDPVMTLTPLGGSIEAEIAVSPREVGFLRPGDPAKLKVDAFNPAEHGTIEGRVSWISEDVFTTGENGGPLPPGVSSYYKVRIAITAEDLKDVPGSVKLVPGMTLTAEIKVGSHSLAMYILGGMIRTTGADMREP